MSSTTVKTVYGEVQGEQLDKVFVWKGIPYAKPPVGPLRFRAPKPPERWKGLRNATEFGPIAPQPKNEIMEFLGNSWENMNEDCLYLNVWSPKADEQKRPVLVWIHGGAFITGSGSEASYNGASFAEIGDVVVVTFNYRLGALGFLHLKELGGETYATSGINGILDQVAALKWVKENIEAFGGDPERVTLFGESAGAMSIGTLLALPAAKGLFHQAILESGASANVVSSQHATQITQQFLDILKITPENLSQLETTPVEQLVEASALVPPMQMVPVVDGDVLPKAPEAAIEEGVAKDIPILIGTNKDEYTLFTCFDPRFKNPTQEELNALFEQTFGELWKQFSPLFLNGKELSTDLYNQLMTQVVFGGPATKLAEVQVKNGAPVWKYRFDWETPVLDGALKSCHALEISFVWNTIHNLGTSRFIGDGPELESLSRQLQQSWIAFAHYGDPNTPLVPEWKPYDLENHSTLLFNEESRLEQDPDQGMRLGWEKIAALLKK